MKKIAFFFHPGVWKPKLYSATLIAVRRVSAIAEGALARRFGGYRQATEVALARSRSGQAPDFFSDVESFLESNEARGLVNAFYYARRVEVHFEPSPTGNAVSIQIRCFRRNERGYEFFGFSCEGKPTSSGTRHRAREK